MKNLIPFFTRLPVKGNFGKAQRELWALPLVAIISSALPTAVLYLNIPLGNVLAVFALYLTIGLLHIDGLADWADGIMVKGDRERKIRAMKDVNTGIAGLFAVVMILFLQVYSLQLVPFYALFLAELNSKLAMLLALATRKPLGQGLGAYFMEGMDRGQLLIGTFLYAVLLIPAILLEPRNLFAIIGLFPGMYSLRLSMKNFGGLNGDCIGAVAEITRAGTLLTLVITWAYVGG